VGLALRLGAAEVAGWSEPEKRLAREAASPSSTDVSSVREEIRAGQDPLGDAFCALRSPVERRPAGATYTSRDIVWAMVAWAAKKRPVRVVDPGAGSGRFTLAAGRCFPAAELVAIEIDPLAAILLRAQVRVADLHRRTRVVVDDFRRLELASSVGTTLFVGNPPYVRHHRISAEWKAWLTATSRRFGLPASRLAGLHVHFMLATATLGRPGDLGCFVTSAEWLDVNYGSLPRKLFLGPLGGKAIHLVEPTAAAFAGVDTTAAILCFEIGAKQSQIAMRRVQSPRGLHPLRGGRKVRRVELDAAIRWTPLTRSVREAPSGYVELGELCRVHRGQVTGSNRVWIEGDHSRGLPRAVLFPTVTKARELFAAGANLRDLARLRRVIDLPADLDELSAGDRRRVRSFLRKAKQMGAADGFIARHRKPWWSVGLKEPAPILATYMARRSPAFVRNLAGARHINIAHGLYPREPLPEPLLDALAGYLSTATSIESGRTYAGGLTKFEPREMERLLVPPPNLLAEQDLFERHPSGFAHPSCVGKSPSGASESRSR